MPRLYTKYRSALRQVEEAKSAFEELDATLDDAHRQQWAAEERDALERFIQDPAALDIYDVKMEQGTLRLCSSNFPADT